MVKDVQFKWWRIGHNSHWYSRIQFCRLFNVNVFLPDSVECERCAIVTIIVFTALIFVFCLTWSANWEHFGHSKDAYFRLHLRPLMEQCNVISVSGTQKSGRWIKICIKKQCLYIEITKSYIYTSCNRNYLQ